MTTYYRMVTFAYAVPFRHDHKQSFGSEQGYEITRPDPETVRVHHPALNHTIDVPWVHVRLAMPLPAFDPAAVIAPSTPAEVAPTAPVHVDEAAAETAAAAKRAEIGRKGALARWATKQPKSDVVTPEGDDHG